MASGHDPKRADPEREIVILGAAGQMTAVTARALIKALPHRLFCLADINLPALERLYGDFAGGRVRVRNVNLFDARQMLAALADACLLVNGAGPFHRTAESARRACLHAGVDYFDIDDEVESTLDGIALDREAAERGVGLYVGHGASPGFSNMLALDLMRRFDRVSSVEVGWTVGDEGPSSPLGRAVAEHMVHICAGDLVTWRRGARVTEPSFETATLFPISGALGDYRLYECAHPEPVTIPWSFPDLDAVTCWGGLHPQELNGIVKGLAHHVRARRLTVDDACTFLQDIAAGKPGSVRGWRAALSGVWGQIAAGENSVGSLLRFIAGRARGRFDPPLAGLAARVTGRIDGRDVVLVRQAAAAERETFLDTMASVTGLSTAAFAIMALEGERRAGFLPPERWADPQRFFDLCRTLGDKPLETIVGPVMTLEGSHAAAR